MLGCLNEIAQLCSVLGPQRPAHLPLLLVAHEPGGAGGHLRHDVPHLPALRRGLHPPLPLPHPLSESLLSTEGCQLGINQPSSNIPSGKSLILI